MKLLLIYLLGIATACMLIWANHSFQSRCHEAVPSANPLVAGDASSKSPETLPEGSITLRSVAKPESHGKDYIRILEGRVSWQFKDRSLAAIVDEIGRISGINFVVSPELNGVLLSGSVTDTPLTNGLAKLLEDHDTFFFQAALAGTRAAWVYPAGAGHLMAPVPLDSWASVDDLVLKLTDPDAGTRSAALDALAVRLGTDATMHLVDALSDPDDRVQLQALDSSVNHGIPLPPDQLQAVLSSGDPQVRRRVLDAMVYPHRLSATTTTDALSTRLDEAVDDPDPSVSSHAKALLEELANDVSP